MIQKNILLLVILLISATALNAQKFFTKQGEISFYSETPMEKFDAKTNTAVCILDTETGAMEFSVLIKSFHFEKALMEEHFNENYMESNTYPKSTFKGKIEYSSSIDFNKNGEHPITVSGKLNMHGVTNEVKVAGKLIIKDGRMSLNSSFKIALSDYKIDIPAIVRDNISNEVLIKVSTNLQELKK